MRITTCFLIMSVALNIAQSCSKATALEVTHNPYEYLEYDQITVYDYTYPEEEEPIGFQVGCECDCGFDF